MTRRFALALLLLAAPCAAHVPVGIRANNPGNVHGVRYWRWVGAVGTDRYHYMRFSSPFYGLRALRIVLEDFYYHKRLVNVSSIRNRWVSHPATPANVRLLRADILMVSRRMGVGPNTTLHFERPGMERRMAQAIVVAENGYDPYPPSLWAQVFPR